jgi:hypothetical protein
MSDAEQRTEWAAHLRDEARAIAKQQLSAGATHEPVEGPLPHSEDALTAAAGVAERAERERCAALAASFANEAVLLRELPWGSAEQRDAAAAIARRIAAVLREPGRAA